MKGKQNLFLQVADDSQMIPVNKQTHVHSTNCVVHTAWCDSHTAIEHLYGMCLHVWR